MSRIATLMVRRGGPLDAARHDRFNVPFEPGQSVLDGLRTIRATQDPTLAFRYACLNANACKECMILLDGKVVYACNRADGGTRDATGPTVQQALAARSGDFHRSAGRAPALRTHPRGLIVSDSRRS
jgi:hypothetical protein